MIIKCEKLNKVFTLYLKACVHVTWQLWKQHIVQNVNIYFTGATSLQAYLQISIGKVLPGSTQVFYGVPKSRCCAKYVQ